MVCPFIRSGHICGTRKVLCRLWFGLLLLGASRFFIGEALLFTLR